MRHKKQMPSYYGKNIAQNAQRRFLKRLREKSAEAGVDKSNYDVQKQRGKGLAGTWTN